VKEWTEQSHLPGYSKEGAEAGNASGVADTSDAAFAVEDMYHTLLHRMLYLGNLETDLGIGYAAPPQRRGGIGFSVLWGPRMSLRDWESPIVVPAPGAVGVPRRVANEDPGVDAHPGFYGEPHGFPVSVTFHPWMVRDVELRVWKLGARGAAPVEGYVFTPDAPVSARRADNCGSAMFCAAEPLAKNTTYLVEFTAVRMDPMDRALRYAWTFRTGAR